MKVLAVVSVVVAIIAGIVAVTTDIRRWFRGPEEGCYWIKNSSPTEPVELPGICSGRQDSAPGNKTQAVCSTAYEGRTFDVFRIKDSRIPFRAVNDHTDGRGSGVSLNNEGTVLTQEGHVCDRLSPEFHIPNETYTCECQ